MFPRRGCDPLSSMQKLLDKHIVMMLMSSQDIQLTRKLSTLSHILEQLFRSFKTAICSLPLRRLHRVSPSATPYISRVKQKKKKIIILGERCKSDADSVLDICKADGPAQLASLRAVELQTLSRFKQEACSADMLRKWL